MKAIKVLQKRIGGSIISWLVEAGEPDTPWRRPKIDKSSSNPVKEPFESGKPWKDRKLEFLPKQEMAPLKKEPPGVKQRAKTNTGHPIPYVGATTSTTTLKLLVEPCRK